jgi:ComF family protein
MRQWLRQYKFLGDQRLAQPFAEMMHPVVIAMQRAYRLPQPMLSYVPVSQSRAQLRGFNQAEILAHELARRSGLPVAPTLFRLTDTEQTSKQNRHARTKEAKNPFLCTLTQTSAKSLIMIDDVYTTGATLNQCAEVLKSTLNIPIYCCTWARSG